MCSICSAIKESVCLVYIVLAFYLALILAFHLAFYLAIFSGILSCIYSGILGYILAFYPEYILINSDILSGIFSDILLGPVVRTAIQHSRLRSDGPTMSHSVMWHLWLTGRRGRMRWRRGTGGTVLTIKSNNPHLAGGENEHRTISYSAEVPRKTPSLSHT